MSRKGLETNIESTLIFLSTTMPNTPTEINVSGKSIYIPITLDVSLNGTNFAELFVLLLPQASRIVDSTIAIVVFFIVVVFIV